MRSIGKEEWFHRVKDRYRKGSRIQKSQILDELQDLHGIHRKAAIRLLSPQKRGRKLEGKKRGPKSKYDNPVFLKALRLIWKETDYMSSKLLHSAMEEWIPFVEQHRGSFDVETKRLLNTISSATIDRKLKPYKGKCLGGTKPGSLLRTEIPIQGNQFNRSVPGFIEADTVAHCGNSLAGQFIWSLTMTDICTGWTECRAVWHKAAQGVVDQVKDVEAHLPFKMLGFDCDNGSEFLNNYLLAYFSEKCRIYNVDFAFTRSRPYHKNDNAHVEQKNWTHPRRLFGRDRLDMFELVEPINDMYKNEFSLVRNHFFPTFKLKGKIRVNSRYRRIYEEPKTPYQRVLESREVSPEKKEELIEIHNSLDPIALREQIQHKINAIYRRYKAVNMKPPSYIAA